MYERFFFHNTKDDGVYTYIDNNIAKVSRSTLMNDPDLTLSADQNDAIHGVALKSLQQSRFACDASAAVTVQSRSASSSSHALPSMDPEECEEADNDAMEDDDEGDDETMMDAQPFLQGLFSRMARPEGKKRSAAAGQTPMQPAKKAKAAPKPKVRVSRKVPVTGDSAPEAPGDCFGLERLDLTSDQGKEDAALIESYINQFKKLKHLDAPGCDDQAFGPWSKTRLAKLSDLRNGLKGKVKSLKRRTSDATDLKASLDEIAEKVTDVHGFIKKLAGSGTEGRELYDELITRIQDDVDYNPSGGVWKRCIRGIAFEDRSVLSVVRVSQDDRGLGF